MVREPLELPIVITVEDDGDKRHIEYAGDRLLSIGRAPDCSIVLEASRASRRHAEIVGEGGHYTLIDAGSANGTHLNGRRIEREGLRAGDVIQIGGATLTFGARARAPAAPPAAAPAVPAAPGARAREGAP
ncbi:MAG: FHA domain-containing protein, partial [Planctomycetota bacterium]